MNILFSGGGTGGSVTPLLAIKEGLAEKYDNEYLWIGTKTGFEKDWVEKYQIPYKSIPSGKLRRYFSWKNFIDPLLIFIGFLKSLWLVFRFKPDLILTAGSFVCVPVVWAAFILRKKIVIHQQDLRIGLANKLMKPFATKITVAFEELADKFPKEKVVVTGNPIRPTLFQGDKITALHKLKLQRDLPVLLVMGGGVGSEIINQVFIEASLELTKFCQVLHVVGKGSQAKWLYNPQITENPRYRAYEFLISQLADAYAAADLFFGRAGLATLTELSALQKPAIVMPIPNNQQIENAKYFNEKKAIVYVRQEDFEKEYVVNLIKDLLSRDIRLAELKKNIYQAMPQNALEEYLRLIGEMAV